MLRDKILSGMSGTYVDDFLRAGNSTFKTPSGQTGKQFDMKPCSSPLCKSSGFRIKYYHDATLQQSQLHYVAKREQSDNT